MKKSMRTLLSLLVALALLVSLPISALAEDNGTDGATIAGECDTNTGDAVVVTGDGVVQTNEGTIQKMKEP